MSRKKKKKKHKSKLDQINEAAVEDDNELNCTSNLNPFDKEFCIALNQARTKPLQTIKLL